MSFVAKQITLFQLAEVVRSLTGPFLRRCVAGFLLSPSAPPVLTKLQPTKIKMHTQRNGSEGLNVYQILRKVFNSISFCLSHVLDCLLKVSALMQPDTAP